MIHYRQDRFTQQVFRRAKGAPEEYVAKEKDWIVTGDAISAFHDSSDYRAITEQEASEAIEHQNRAADNKL